MHSEEQLRGRMCRMATPLKYSVSDSLESLFYESYTKLFRPFTSDRTREISKVHPSFVSSGWWFS